MNLAYGCDENETTVADAANEAVAFFCWPRVGDLTDGIGVAEPAVRAYAGKMMSMSARASQILVVLSVVVVGLVVLLTVVLYTGGQFGGSGHAEIGGPFKLVGEDGKLISDRTMREKPYLLFFGYTHCADICPTTLFEMSQVMRALGKDADRTRGLFITVDPERDTPAVMKEYLSNFDPHLRGATGDPKSIHAVEKEFRVYAKKVPAENGDYSMDHSATVYLMNKQGRFIAPFNLKQSPQAAAAELRKYF